MKFTSFFWSLIVGAIAIFLAVMVGLGWMVSQSSFNLLFGGVNYFPNAAIFMPKQAPAMVSLLTNPDRLEGWYEVSLPLKKRQSNRREWQQWEQDLAAKIGFDYQRDIKPWLGEEITLAIATLDGDRNSQNGVQPGYILALETKNSQLAKESIRNFYRQQPSVTIEEYKGTNILAIDASDKSVWSSVVVGNFVLFTNQSPLLKEAINQAQAVNLNLSQSKSYQTALNNIQPNHIGVSYIDVLALTAWLDKSAVLPRNGQTLAVSLGIKQSDLAAQTALFEPSNSLGNPSSAKSFLDNPELQQIMTSLPFDRRNSAYIEIKEGKSLLEDQIPLYKVTKLAIKSLFPRLKAIAIQNLGTEDNISRTNIRFKLDN